MSTSQGVNTDPSKATNVSNDVSAHTESADTVDPPRKLRDLVKKMRQHQIDDRSGSNVASDLGDSAQQDTTAIKGTEASVGTASGEAKESSSGNKGKQPAQSEDYATPSPSAYASDAEEDEDIPAFPSLDGVDAAMKAFEEAFEEAMTAEFPEFAESAKDSAAPGASSQARTGRHYRASASGATGEPSAADARAFLEMMTNMTQTLSALPGMFNQLAQQESDMETGFGILEAALSGKGDEAQRLRGGLSQSANNDLTEYMKRYEADPAKAQQEVLDKLAEFKKKCEEDEEDE